MNLYGVTNGERNKIICLEDAYDVHKSGQRANVADARGLL